MRKFLLAFPLAGLLALAGCLTPQEVIALVQQDTQAACGFVPTVESVAAILSALIPGGTQVEQIAAQVANQICASVTAKSLAPGRIPHVIVNGRQIAVHGHFVKK